MEYSLINGYWSLWEDLAAREPVDVVKLISPEHANVPRCLWRWGIQEAVDTSLCESHSSLQPLSMELHVRLYAALDKQKASPSNRDWSIRQSACTPGPCPPSPSAQPELPRGKLLARTGIGFASYPETPISLIQGTYLNILGVLL